MASCYTPINIKPKKGEPPRDGFSFHSVPCGKCPACRLRRIQGWVFRLKQEEKRHGNAWFITLTYEVPPLTTNGFMTLHKPDLAKFWKRLRFNTKRKTIKYYACGEYGGKTFRPHYHAIVFDIKTEEVDKAWSGEYDPICKNDPAIKLGHVVYGQVSDDSIAYTAKYIAKEGKIPMHDHDDRQKEFSVMSKGLGSNYLTNEIITYHERNRASYLTMPGGATHAMPRYYRDRIFTKEDLEHINANLGDKFNKKFAEDVQQFGSIEEYYRVRHYALIDKAKQFNNQENRNKL